MSFCSSRAWSPRSRTSVSCPSSTYTSVLICRSAGASYPDARSSIVRTPGVSNRSGAASATAASAAESTGGSADIAFSTLAAYPQSGHTMMSSSPLSDGQTNSVESDPPMVPLDASAGIAGMPSRSNARLYALKCRSYDRSRPAASRSKL